MVALFNERGPVLPVRLIGVDWVFCGVGSPRQNAVPPHLADVLAYRFIESERGKTTGLRKESAAGWRGVNRVSLRWGNGVGGTAWLSGRSFESDEGQMLAAGCELDHEFGVSATRSADGSLRRGTETLARPACARFNARLGVCGLATVVDFIGRFAAKELMRPIAVVPVNTEPQLGGHAAHVKRDERQGCHAFGLQRFDEAFDDRDAAVLADGAEAGSHVSAFAPAFEARAPELGTLVGDVVLGLPAGHAQPIPAGSQLTCCLARRSVTG